MADVALFAVVFGADYREAGVFAQLLAVVLLAGFIVSSLSPVIVVLERQDWQLYGDITRSVIVIAALVLANYLQAGPRVAVAAFAVAMLVTYAGYYAMFCYSLKCKIVQATEAADPSPQGDASRCE